MVERLSLRLQTATPLTASLRPFSQWFKRLGEPFRQLLSSHSLMEQYRNIIDDSVIVSKSDARGVITYANSEKSLSASPTVLSGIRIWKRAFSGRCGGRSVAVRPGGVL